MSVKGERGHMKMIIESLQLWGRHRLSKNILEQTPAFWQKNVRCIVGRAHDAVNKIYNRTGVHLPEKCPFSVKVKNF